jgi:hypothetical protein
MGTCIAAPEFCKGSPAVSFTRLVARIPRLDLGLVVQNDV